MKYFFRIIACVCLIVSIAHAQQTIPSAQVGTHYGSPIEAEGAISVDALESTLQRKKIYSGKVTGEVVQVCQKKGCFLTLKREKDQEPILVRFTDYAFFVPEDIAGKTVVLEGRAKVKETSVAWQQHYAEDMGKSKAEIAKINQPKRDISFVADGVLVVK